MGNIRWPLFIQDEIEPIKKQALSIEDDGIDKFEEKMLNFIGWYHYSTAFDTMQHLIEEMNIDGENFVISRDAYHKLTENHIIKAQEWWEKYNG